MPALLSTQVYIWTRLPVSYYDKGEKQLTHSTRQLHHDSDSAIVEAQTVCLSRSLTPQRANGALAKLRLWGARHPRAVRTSILTVQLWLWCYFITGCLLYFHNLIFATSATYNVTKVFYSIPFVTVVVDFVVYKQNKTKKSHASLCALGPAGLVKLWKAH